MEVWESNTYEGYPALAKMYAGLPYVGEWGEDVHFRGCQHIEAVSWPCSYYCLWKRKIRSSQSLNLLRTSSLWIKSRSEKGSSNVVVSQSEHHCASAWTMFTLWGSRSGIPAQGRGDWVQWLHEPGVGDEAHQGQSDGQGLPGHLDMAALQASPTTGLQPQEDSCSTRQAETYCNSLHEVQYNALLMHYSHLQ